MAISFQCPRCGKGYQQPEFAAGRAAKCSCGEQFVVPQLGAESDIPQLTDADLAPIEEIPQLTDADLAPVDEIPQLTDADVAPSPGHQTVQAEQTNRQRNCSRKRKSHNRRANKHQPRRNGSCQPQ